MGALEPPQVFTASIQFISCLLIWCAAFTPQLTSVSSLFYAKFDRTPQWSQQTHRYRRTASENTNINKRYTSVRLLWHIVECKQRAAVLLLAALAGFIVLPSLHAHPVHFPHINITQCCLLELLFYQSRCIHRCALISTSGDIEQELWSGCKHYTTP